MKTFFIGSLYPNERIDEFQISSGKFGLDNAANNLQWALLDGVKYYSLDITVITQPNTRSFPLNNKTLLFKKSFFSHNGNSKDTCLGYINFPVLKHISRWYNLFMCLNKVIPKNEDSLVIIYGMHSPFLLAVSSLRRAGWRKMKICLIVPDLPQYMRETTNSLYLGLKKIDSHVINYSIKCVDCFVLINENMRSQIPIENKPWVRVEGIYNSEEQCVNIEKEKYKTILYTGNLSKRSGITTLLTAFASIKDEGYRLWIRGDGVLKKHVLDAAKYDGRISYFDTVPIDELQTMLKRATVLINPVSNKEPFTRFFFPSKLMNYMASGTPVITTEIEGIPAEYYKYLFVTKGEDTTSISKAIVDVCSKSDEELNSFGSLAKDFVFHNKNSKVQFGKMVKMFEACQISKLS